MFDARIAIEETQPDLTDQEIQEMNEFHDRIDREYDERCRLADTISDLSKDVQGFRYRFDWQTIPMDELRALYDEWIDRHRDYMRDYDADHVIAMLDMHDAQHEADMVQDELCKPDPYELAQHILEKMTRRAKR